MRGLLDPLSLRSPKADTMRCVLNTAEDNESERPVFCRCSCLFVDRVRGQLLESAECRAEASADVSIWAGYLSSLHARTPRCQMGARLSTHPYQIGNAKVKQVPRSRAKVIVPCSCLVNRQAIWRPRDFVLWKSTPSGKPIPVSWTVTVSWPAGSGPNADRHIPRPLAWKGMLQTVRN